MSSPDEDMRMLVCSGIDEDEVPVVRPWLSIKDDAPVERSRPAAGP